MYKSLRPLLFRLDPERAHSLTLRAIGAAGNFPPARALLTLLSRAPAKPVHAFGLTFPNSIGLAAGYDKDGTAIRGLSALGFGHVEIGTVTPRPQPGNPAPRVFRLAEDEAVINRMGFPSRGSEFVQMQLNPALNLNWIERLVGFDRRRKKGFQRLSAAMLGINLGKNKDTPNEQAVFDYIALVDVFAPYADYLTINISSPNTAGLRRLQERGALESLLTHIHQQREICAAQRKKKLPILVKLAPDLSESELDDALDVILRAKMDGVILTNTTLARAGLRSGLGVESGGLSGVPLRPKSEAILRRAARQIGGALPIVSAGGIMTPEDVKQRLELGATLAQVYTGLIYYGPALPRDALRAINL